MCIYKYVCVHSQYRICTYGSAKITHTCICYWRKQLLQRGFIGRLFLSPAASCLASRHRREPELYFDTQCLERFQTCLCLLEVQFRRPSHALIEGGVCCNGWSVREARYLNVLAKQSFQATRRFSLLCMRSPRQRRSYVLVTTYNVTSTSLS